MIILQPEIKIKNGEVWVSAQVEFAKFNKNVPPRLWFCFPERYSQFISDRSDGFITCLFYLGMAYGEDITVHGTVSPRLAYGLDECQRVFTTWFPHIFRHITIQYDHLIPVSPDEAGTQVALAFSGGIDSTFTLYHHLPPAQQLPQYQISQCIFTHGFDIPLTNNEYYQNVVQKFSAALEPYNVNLVECKTNLQSFIVGRLNWTHAHGGGMIGNALILSKLVKTILVSSSWSLRKFEPWGSSVMSDPMLSTEQFETIYYGFPYSRMEKVEIISQWEPARKFLRVCLKQKRVKHTDNCCRCDKCLRTMISLEATGNLKYFKTFTRPLRISDYFRWIPGYVIHVPEIVTYLLKHKKFKTIPLLILPHIKAWSRHILKDSLPHSFKMWVKDMLYDENKDPYSYKNLPPELDF